MTVAWSDEIGSFATRWRAASSDLRAVAIERECELGRAARRSCDACAVNVREHLRGRYGPQLDGLRALAALVAIMWAVELVNLLDGYRLDSNGIVPRSVSHLDGIVFAPFLHASISHILGNTIPLVILGFAIALAGARRLLTVTAIVAVVSGLGVWLIAPAHTDTVGASGVVFGYATYLISRGLFNRRLAEVALGVLVAVLFGGALIADLVPHAGVSWQAHLFGGIGGVLAASALSAGPRERKRERAAGVATPVVR